MRRALARHKWAVALGLLLVFLILAVLYPTLTTAEDRINAAVASARTSWGCALAKGFSALASPLALLIISGLAVLITPQKEYRIPLLANLIVAVLLNLGLKSVFMRPRPDVALAAITEVGSSFPSGHSMASAAFYGFFIFLARRGMQQQKAKTAWTLALGGVILLIGFSRIYLGVHYPSDVLAGFCISGAYLSLFTAVVNRYLEQGVDLPTEKNTSKKNEKLGYSFVHAFEGIASGLKTERNLLVHFSVMALVVVFGALLGISRSEWLVCVVLFGLVFAAELINTAIETTVDLCMPDVDPRAKLAKDTAAGAVLCAAIASAVAGAIIFLPKLWALLPFGN